MPGSYQLVPRQSVEETFDDPIRHDTASAAIGGDREVLESTGLPRWFKTLPFGGYPRTRRRRRRKFLFLLQAIALLIAALIILTPIFRPSYTRRPLHYTGGNPNGEKVFIASTIVKENLIRGAWGQAVVDLVERLGPQNAYLSVYANDAGPGTASALEELAARVECNSSISYEKFPFEGLPRVILPSGEERVRRIAYLAAVRNRSLSPLDSRPGPNLTPNSVPRGYNDPDLAMATFDKVLILNDIVFSAKDAADLLFATGVGSDGKTKYLAACAMDFLNPVKFYDTWVLRDAEGYGIGVPFFPWFTAAGDGQSRRDVLAQKDTVPVKSCWGGLVAFQAQWFQPRPASADWEQPKEEFNASDDVAMARTVESGYGSMALPDEPLRFRAEEELTWESSECCLLQADLQSRGARAGLPEDPVTLGGGVVVNPYIRVAYDAETFGWLELSRRFEKLYPLVHWIISWVAGLPHDNHRRTEIEGETIIETVPDIITGHLRTSERIVKPGGYCGGRQLLLLKPEWEPGQKNWYTYHLPQG